MKEYACVLNDRFLIHAWLGESKFQVSVTNNSASDILARGWFAPLEYWEKLEDQGFFDSVEKVSYFSK